MSTSSRQQILGRIRAATHADDNNYADIPRNYIHRGNLNTSACLQLTTERLREYDATVTETSPADLPTTITQILVATQRRRPFVIPAALPPEWLSPEIHWLPDHNLSHEQIEDCDGVLTTASAGIADSGTIVIHHTPTEGRRVITLLPDFHLCILRASQIVETLPEYFTRFPEPPRLATFISGPSATADIEMTRIKGVHGPRFLSVILVRDDV